MREIKFRGKYKNTWYYGSFVKMIDWGESYDIYQEETQSFCLVEKDTVGQYTGLKDKNCVEIYEGDIVASCGRRDLPCLVEYNQDRCEFIMRYGGDGILHIVEEFKNSYEVIGNIYDNPELLEVKE